MTKPIRINDILHTRLKKLSKNTGISITVLGEDAILEYIKNNKDYFDKLSKKRKELRGEE